MLYILKKIRKTCPFCPCYDNISPAKPQTPFTHLQFYDKLYLIGSA